MPIRSAIARRPAALLAAALVALCVSGVALGASLPGTDTPKDRTRWRAILHWPATCEKSWNTGHPDTAGVRTWSLGKGRRLVAVTCFLGAYQGTAMLYLLDARHRPGRALTLHIYTDPGSGTPTPTRTRQPLGDLSFTPKTSTLWIVDKFRGVGDCGISSKFRLSGGQFVPTVSRAKTACDGKPPYDPNRWPELPLLHV